MKKYKILISILMVLLFVSACATNTDDSKEPSDNQQETPNDTIPNDETSDGDTPDEETPEASPETGSNNSTDTKYFKTDFKVSLDEFDIFDKFVEEYQGVKVTEIELSLKNNAYVYEIEGMTSSEEIEAKYDANTGDLVQVERESYDGNKNILVREDLNQVKEFFNLVFDDAGEAYHLKEWTLKDKNGKKIIEFEVVNEDNNEIEYKYDYETKELIEKD